MTAMPHAIQQYSFRLKRSETIRNFSNGSLSRCSRFFRLGRSGSSASWFAGESTPLLLLSVFALFKYCFFPENVVAAAGLSKRSPKQLVIRTAASGYSLLGIIYMNQTAAPESPVFQPLLDLPGRQIRKKAHAWRKTADKRVCPFLYEEPIWLVDAFYASPP